MGVERDIERIRHADTLEAIRVIAREYAASIHDSDATLYSGRIGVVSANELAVERAMSVQSAIIDDTPRGRFLAHDLVREAIEDSATRILQSQGADRDLALKLRDDFLYGDPTAPKYSITSIQNCLWCEASRDFASSLRGDVKVIAVNANPQRVFAQVEVPTALQNPHVRSLGGVPVELLRTTYAELGVEGVLPQVQAAYVREASLAGLLSTPVAEPVAGIRRAPAATFRVAQVATKALGAAATAYDGVASVRQAMRLSEQGNDTGAQSHIVGSVARSVGGWGGAALGASTGAALTAETGPGALLGGAVGGIAGAVAGDRLAAWIDRHRINHQTDAEGHRWAFDPAHPANGWTRTVTGELDAQATVDRGFPVYISQTLTASPELADRLNYQASSRAVELALSAPPTPHDPYRAASTPDDHRPGHLYEGDWQRDAQTGRWSRQVTGSHVGLSMQRFDTETASPSRAAALDRHAQEVVAANLQAMPAMVAADYQAAYDRFGWSRHGDMPAAVLDAITHPGRMVASDGQTYTQGPDGRWTTPGSLYGRNPAEDCVQHELDVAYRRLQQASAETDEGSTASGSEDSDNTTAIGALARKHDAPAEHVTVPLGVAPRTIGLAGPGFGRGSDERAATSGSDGRAAVPHDTRDAPGRPADSPIFDAAEQHRLYRDAMHRQREEQAETWQREQDGRNERRRTDDRAADDRTWDEWAYRYHADEDRYRQHQDALDSERRFVDTPIPASRSDDQRVSPETEAARRALAETHAPASHRQAALRHAPRIEGEGGDPGSRPLADRSWKRVPESPVVMESEHERSMREARHPQPIPDPSAIDAIWLRNLDTPRWDEARDVDHILFQRDDSHANGRTVAHDDPFPHAVDPIASPVAPDPYANIDPADPFSYNPYLPGMPEEDKDMADMWLALQSNNTQAIDRAFDKLAQRPEVQQLLDEAADILERERIELAAQRQAALDEQRRIDEMIRAQREAEAQQHGPVKVLTLGLQPLTAMDMGGGSGGDGGGGDGGG